MTHHTKVLYCTWSLCYSQTDSQTDFTLKRLDHKCIANIQYIFLNRHCTTGKRKAYQRVRLILSRSWKLFIFLTAVWMGKKVTNIYLPSLYKFHQSANKYLVTVQRCCITIDGNKTLLDILELWSPIVAILCHIIRITHACMPIYQHNKTYTEMLQYLILKIWGDWRVLLLTYFHDIELCIFFSRCRLLITKSKI